MHYGNKMRRMKFREWEQLDREWYDKHQPWLDDATPVFRSYPETARKPDMAEQEYDNADDLDDWS